MSEAAPEQQVIVKKTTVVLRTAGRGRGSGRGRGRGGAKSPRSPRPPAKSNLSPRAKGARREGGALSSSSPSIPQSAGRGRGHLSPRARAIFKRAQPRPSSSHSFSALSVSPRARTTRSSTLIGSDRASPRPSSPPPQKPPPPQQPPQPMQSAKVGIPQAQQQRPTPPAKADIGKKFDTVRRLSQGSFARRRLLVEKRGAIPFKRDHVDSISSISDIVNETLQGSNARVPSLDAPTAAREESNDQIWVWGDMCQLLGSSPNPHPQPLPPLQSRNVKLVAAGSHHFVLMLDDASVYTWGEGSGGRLGHGSEESLAMPRLVEGLRGVHVRTIAAGGAHSSACGSSDDSSPNHLWYWGHLGIPEHDAELVPRVHLERNVTHVAMGSHHVLALADSKSVYVWGCNTNGCLGLGKREGDIILKPQQLNVSGTPVCVAASDRSSAYVNSKGSVYFWGANWRPGGKILKKPEKMGLKIKVESVAIGWAHVLLLTQEGLVYSVGAGGDGQLGSGYLTDSGEIGVVEFPLSKEEKLRQLKAKSHAGSVAASSSLKLRTGTRSPRIAANPSVPSVAISAVAAGHSSSCARTHDGRVFMWGKVMASGTESFLQPTLVRALDKIAIERVALSASQVVALVGLKNEEDLVFHSFNPPIIKRASLPKLVDWLVSERGQAEKLFTFSFLLSFPFFTSSAAFLAELRTRYELSDQEGMQARVLRVLKRWAKLRPRDFRAGEGIKRALDALLSKMPPAHSSAIRKQLERSEAQAPPPLPPAPSASASLASGRRDPRHVALHLAHLDLLALRRIDASELVRQRWSGRDKKDNAPNVLAMVARFNRLFYHIVTRVVAHEREEERSQGWAFWGEVFRASLECNNLNACVCIASALNAVPIRKLVKRQLLTKKQPIDEELSAFRKLLSERNKAGYREKLAAIVEDGEPGVPYLATLLSDLTFIEDGNKDMLEGLVHFYKFHLIAKTVQVVMVLQERSYATEELNSELLAYLDNVRGESEEVCDAIVNAIVSGERTVAQVLEESSADKGQESLAVTLEEEAQCGAGERLETWKRWLSRSEELGDEFRLALCAGTTFSSVFESVLRYPLEPMERVVFQALLQHFLAPGISARRVCDLLASLGEAQLSEEGRARVIRFMHGHVHSPLVDGQAINELEAALTAQTPRSRPKVLLESIDFAQLELMVEQFSGGVYQLLRLPELESQAEFSHTPVSEALRAQCQEREDAIARLEEQQGDLGELGGGGGELRALEGELAALQRREEELEGLLREVRAKKTALLAKRDAARQAQSAHSVTRDKERSVVAADLESEKQRHAQAQAALREFEGYCDGDYQKRLVAVVEQLEECQAVAREKVRLVSALLDWLSVQFSECLSARQQGADIERVCGSWGVLEQTRDQVAGIYEQVEPVLRLEGGNEQADAIASTIERLKRLKL